MRSRSLSCERNESFLVEISKKRKKILGLIEGELMGLELNVDVEEF